MVAQGLVLAPGEPAPRPQPGQHANATDDGLRIGYRERLQEDGIEERVCESARRDAEPEQQGDADREPRSAPQPAKGVPKARHSIPTATVAGAVCRRSRKVCAA